MLKYITPPHSNSWVRRYVNILVRRVYSHVPTFSYTKLFTWLSYPSSYSSTSSIESTTFWISSLSNHNTNNIKSVTLTPSSLVLFLKVQSILKSIIRGILLSELFYWPISLMPPVRSSASKYRSKLVSLILSLSEIMPSCSYCVEKRLSYIIILAPFSCQPFSYIKCTKSNMYLSCDIRLVSNTKYTYLIHPYVLRSLQLPYLIYLRVSRSSVYYKT